MIRNWILRNRDAIYFSEVTIEKKTKKKHSKSSLGNDSGLISS